MSAKLKKSNQVGSLYWKGDDYKIGKLVDIPSHVQFDKGDTIITSGFSNIFPEGQMIGVVENSTLQTGDNFYTIDVRFAVDFNNIYYVFVIENLMQQELLELNEKEIIK